MSWSIEQALEVLGVTADSDPDAVAHAYRRLARATHPDVSPQPDAAERFAALEAAYRLVADHARARLRAASRTEPRVDAPSQPVASGHLASSHTVPGPWWSTPPSLREAATIVPGPVVFRARRPGTTGHTRSAGDA